MSLVLDEGLSFTDEGHEYRFGGRVVPGVTQLLSGLQSFAGVPADVLELAQDRGRFVHRMCELHDLDDLDETDPALDPYRGYLAGWKRFLDLYRPNWSGIEERGYSKTWGYAGTMDRRGVFEVGNPSVQWILDIKTSEAAHWCWGVQTAAYRQLVIEHDRTWALAKRATVQLQRTGAFKFHQWTDADDWPTFASLLQLHHKGMRHGTANPAR